MNIDDLKCCGNCKFMEVVWEDYDFHTCKHGQRWVTIEANCICKQWQFDGMTREDREE